MDFMNLMNEFPYENSTSYRLIFFHNATKGKVFEKGEELFCRTNDFSKFSDLGVLSDKYKIGGYFEFVLQYNYPNKDKSVIHWRQKANPIETESGQSEVGYEPINVSKGLFQFEGLAKSSQIENSEIAEASCFLDGTLTITSTSNWWYSVCAYRFYPNASSNTVPGFSYQSAKVVATEAFLWVRIPDLITEKSGSIYFVHNIFFYVMIVFK